MCIHYENSLCAVRLDSCVDQKEKMSSHYHFRILFASKESKQDYVSLVLFRIRALTYASRFPKQQLPHSRSCPPFTEVEAHRMGSLSSSERWGDRDKGCPGSRLIGRRRKIQTLARFFPGKIMQPQCKWITRCPAAAESRPSDQDRKRWNLWENSIEPHLRGKRNLSK